MKRQYLFAALVSGVLAMTACGGSSQTEANSTSGKTISGEQIYNDNCVICHGVDGKAQMAGATDLSVSTLNAEAASAVITNGRNGMRSFSSELTKDEIDAVVKHIESLRK